MKTNKNYDILKKFYKNKKIFITGATGFKGAWLSFWLYKMGAKVYSNWKKSQIKMTIYFMDLVWKKKLI